LKSPDDATPSPSGATTFAAKQRAPISRLAIGPFVLFYAAWRSVIGLAIGALIQHGNDAPARQRPVVADAIQSLGNNVIVGDSDAIARSH
jgi:hypothetical protein